MKLIVHVYDKLPSAGSILSLESGQSHAFETPHGTKVLIVAVDEEVDDTPEVVVRKGFRQELEKLLNVHSKDKASNTPDYVLAMFLDNCLEAFIRANNNR